MGSDRNRDFIAKRGGILGGLQEVLFSANVACALGYALALYVFRSSGSWPPHDDAGYYFLLGAARVSDLLHLGAVSAVSTDAVARRSSVIWNRFAIETAYLSILSCVASLVFLIVMGIRSAFPAGAVFRRISGVVALFAAPACCLLVLKLTWNWKIDFSQSPVPFQQSFFFSIFVGEVLGFLVLYFIGRKRAISPWTSGILLAFHFAFWGFVLFPDVLLYMRGIIAFYFFHLALWLVPSAGAAWLAYVRPSRDGSFAFAGDRTASSWTIVPAVLILAMSLAIWVPARNYPLRPKDLNSVVVELSRGPCYGTCPAYTIAVHGNGSVEYVGKMFARRGRQTGTVGSEEIERILQSLEQARFFALDDRAFSWCFDTSSVSVTVSFDGRSKRVVSDAGCTGAPSGVQGRFVRAADNIDKIVDSERWVRCDDGPCRR
jgi:hypothetical protein